MATNLCSSIEMEPRTLNEGELNHAREVAAHIVQNMERKAASDVFTVGLRPVVSVKKMEQIMVVVEKEEIDGHQATEKLNHKSESGQGKMKASEKIPETKCQCSVECPEEANALVREPLSAPF